MWKALADGLLRWFERRRGRGRNHRAFFAAAPRYAALAAAITAIPFLIYWLSGHWWALFVVTAVGAAAVFALVYLFFTTVGALERQNEANTARLAEAHDVLAGYAARIHEDLDRARQIQQRMLPGPDEMPLTDRLDWASRFIPEAEVGGDYFDAAMLDDRRLAILFGDVSGHGMAAAFVTAILKTTFQAWVDDADAPADFFRRLNSHLCRMTPEDSFAAVFLAVYDAATGELEYLNGGHHPEPWVIPADPAQPPTALSDARCVLLGVVEQFAIRQGRRRLRPGDKVLIVTDGLIEAQNARREMFTLDRLARLLADERRRPVKELVDLVVDRVTTFAAAGPVLDDRTVLAFEVKAVG